jgi:hypothetical protein
MPLPWSDDLSFEDLRKLFIENGCTSVLVKAMAPNDNSKNQVFVGNDLTEVASIPSGSMSIVPGTSKKKSLPPSIVHARLNLLWLTELGTVEAPSARLIYYPQYPEVRLSGFLKGVKGAPNDLLNPAKRGREPGRLLLLGINEQKKAIFMTVLSANGIPNVAVRAATGLSSVGVFSIWDLGSHDADASKQGLIDELCRIHSAGWINSKRLKKDGPVPYLAQNGGGYTLEAELGILPNGYAAPDFYGWEVKQHATKSFVRHASGSVTLFTPEPDGGVYVHKGLEEFLTKWGKTKAGSTRLDFAGRHLYSVRSSRTKLMLDVDGYIAGETSFDASGRICLRADDGTVAAEWSFKKLLQHWKKKHSNAVYVPSKSQWVTVGASKIKQYHFGPVVDVAVGTSFGLFLEGVVSGVVFYDPGIHMTPGGESKRRNQFRVNYRKLSTLYEHFDPAKVCVY